MENDRELLDSLRALAADGPQTAPDRVELRLLAEFRRRKTRNRVRVWTSLVGAAALAAGIAVFVWSREAPRPAATPAVTTLAAASFDAGDDSDTSFYPLPEAEALPAMETAVVVQVQLPVSSLRLMGVPVDEEREGAVQAELLLGQDGLARGVRLAQ
ncbi:MAG TPA: hypothetical protein VME17_11930 [Bryobacteraceae bacterium]|nr:hypothetical protein [Bryobacteraceae bacterium]